MSASDIWKPVHQPTRREIEQREKERAAQREIPQPIPGRPGFTIDKNGRFGYNPSDDPTGRAYK